MYEHFKSMKKKKFFKAIFTESINYLEENLYLNPKPYEKQIPN